MSHIHSIFHNIFLYNTFNPIQILKRILSGRPLKLCHTCDQVGDYAYPNSVIYSISWGLTNYELGYGQYVYNGRGGVEGALNCVCV